MSAVRVVVVLAAAVAVLPVVLRDRDAGPVTAGAAALPATAQEQRADPAAVRAFLDGVRGANAIQCEVILQSFDSWSSNRAPDRDSVAWSVTTVVRRRITAPQSVPDLVAALRGGDDCAARVAARLLGRSRLPAARGELLSALGDASPQVRRLGAIGLGFSSDTTASPQLVRALADRDAGVRAAAAWALGAVH
ncbi:MAG TPA: HEAT repeat domain-containing protein [Gemmatimonadaceae bacterium]|nr:HEAT repeat domain-containing protein [Gemmatimonadaceae bacterium]